MLLQASFFISYIICSQSFITSPGPRRGPSEFTPRASPAKLHILFWLMRILPTIPLLVILEEFVILLMTVDDVALFASCCPSALLAPPRMQRPMRRKVAASFIFEKIDMFQLFWTKATNLLIPNTSMSYILYSIATSVSTLLHFQPGWAQLGGPLAHPMTESVRHLFHARSPVPSLRAPCSRPHHLSPESSLTMYSILIK